MEGRRMMKILHTSLAVVLLWTVLAVDAPAQGPTPAVIKLGFLAPLSGSASGWGVEQNRAVTVILDKLNEEGGVTVGGKKYKFAAIFYDSQALADPAATGTYKLINEDRVTLIAALTSPEGTAMRPIAEAAKIINFHGGFACNPKPEFPYSFRVISGVTEFFPVAFPFLVKNHGIKTVAFLTTNDATGRYCLPFGQKVAPDYGLRVVAGEYYPPRVTTDFSPILLRVIAQGADGIVLLGITGKEAGLIVKQARGIGYKGPIFDVGSPDPMDIVEVAGAAAEGIYYTGAPDFKSPAATPEMKEFDRRLDAKFPGTGRGGVTPCWINALWLYAQAVKAADSINQDALVKIMPTLKYHSIWGPGTLALGGEKIYGIPHQVIEPATITWIKGGKAAVVTTAFQ